MPGHEDYDSQQQAECCECFTLIVARCGPRHRASDYGQTMLHEVGARAITVWAFDSRIELVRLFLARGADPVEADAEPWASPRAWAERMHGPQILELLTPPQR